MLQKRGVQTPNRCCLCKSEEETLNHLLLTCNFTRQLWEVLLVVHPDARHALPCWNTVLEVLQNWPVWNGRSLAAEIWDVLPYAVMWTVWKSRNAIIFDNVNVSAGMIIQHIKASVWQWLNMSSRAMELREKVQFSDLVHGWRYVMVDQQ
ncbi:hypothetical protein FRX31_028960 [Thalictrum thalictroides]|uniref:Reverse transcriptase zinc-binding domain-containing protein n=1 Tax=Thalictrum thalictroides TaxID=46969 RepID=A0A7J6V922_THATH|nr:hypothetical protein FRX31_028960 [Thalictrum thalictroides]